MNAFDLFALFDVALVNQTSEFSILSTDKSTKKTLFLKDVATIENNFYKELFLFIGWLVEDINREMFFCKQCSIRFLHVQGNLDLMKVSLSANSRCVLHFLKTCEAWTNRCTIGWNDYCEVLRKNDQLLVNRSNSVDSLFLSLKIPDSRKVGRVTSTDSVKPRGQSVISSMEENIQLLRARYALTSMGGSSLRRSRFSLRRLSTSGPTTVADIDLASTEPSSPSTQKDTPGFFETLDIPSNPNFNCGSSSHIIQEKMMNACSASSLVSTTDSGSSSTTSDANSDTQSSDGHYRTKSPTHEQQPQQCCEGIAMISSSCFASLKLDSPSKAVENRSHSVVVIANSEKPGDTPSSLVREKFLPSPASPSTSICQISRSFSDDFEYMDMSLEDPIALLAAHNSGGDIAGSGEDCEMQVKRKSNRIRVTTVKLSKLPKAANELCSLFRVKTEAIFNGDYLEKKFDRDFLFKRRFIWIDPSTRSINWAKSSEERYKNPKMSKFLLLKRFYTKRRTIHGQSKGVAHDVSFDASGMTLMTESGQQLTIKISGEVQLCWQRIILILRN